METKHVVMFSGGKDSTAMLLMMMEDNMKIDDIIFCDTGVEFEELYNHIKQIEKYIKREITILKPDKSFEYWLLNHELLKGKHKGCKGYGFPSMKVRWCTSNLKRTLKNKYLNKYKGYNIIEYVGIAYDEPKRILDKKYPLVDKKVTEKMALDYCYSKGFHWGGLYDKFDRLGCWCCPLKSLKELKTLKKYYPNKWQKLIEWESVLRKQRIKENRDDNWMFKTRHSVKELDKRFNKEIENE